MKMLLAATLVGAAIAGLLLYSRRPAPRGLAAGNGLDAMPHPDTLRGAHAMG